MSEENGIRSFINRNPAVVGGVVLVLAAVTLYFVAGRTFSNKKIEAPSYYTVDDGETTFIDERDKVPPFKAKGGEAVRAIVAREPGGEPFVHYLVKYKEEVRARIENADAHDFKRPSGGALYKKPGEGEWLDGDDPSNRQAIREIKNLKLEDGRFLSLLNPPR